MKWIVALVAIVIGAFWLASFPMARVTISGSDGRSRALADFLAQKGTSGALLVTKDDNVVSELYWGSATRDTLFDLGSLSKQFTGFLILQLEQEKKLSVQNLVEEILPETHGTPIGVLVVEDLLHMTSGLPHNEDWKVKLRSQLLQENWDSQQIVHEIAKYQPTFTGEKFQYSNLGYVLAAQIISRLEGKPFGVVLQDRIFRAFQMQDTYLQAGRPKDPRLARGYFPVFGRWLPLPAWNYAFLQGAGGIVSNVRDLWKWNQGLRQYFAVHPDLTSRYYGLDNRFHYGYGWSTRDGLSSHDGESPGFCTYVAKNDHALLILTLNSDFCTSGDDQDTMENLANAEVRAN